MDVRAKGINTEMKVAVAKARAALAKQEVPEYLNVLYDTKLVFWKDYLITKPFDLETYKIELATRI